LSVFCFSSPSVSLSLSLFLNVCVCVCVSVGYVSDLERQCHFSNAQYLLLKSSMVLHPARN
jgi:hypothetical protein